MNQVIEEHRSVWGWKIALYLYLVGLACGAYLTGVGAEFGSGIWRTIPVIGVTAGSLVAVFSTLFLFWPLGRAFGYYREAIHPYGSWVSRGLFIMAAFILVSLAHMGGLLWQTYLPVYVAPPEVVLRAIGVVGGVLAVVTLVGTGLLLVAVPDIPLWRTPYLPILFVVSGLSAGMMTVSLIHSIYLFVQAETQGGRFGTMMAENSLLAAGSALLVIEAVVIFVYLYLVRTVRAGKPSVDSLISGEHALFFWSTCVVMGLIIPLSIQLTGAVLLDDNAVGTRASAAAVAALPTGLWGGYVLRHLIMAAAIKAVPESSAD